MHFYKLHTPVLPGPRSKLEHSPTIPAPSCPSQSLSSKSTRRPDASSAGSLCLRLRFMYKWNRTSYTLGSDSLCPTVFVRLRACLNRVVEPYGVADIPPFFEPHKGHSIGFSLTECPVSSCAECHYPDRPRRVYLLHLGGRLGRVAAFVLCFPSNKRKRKVNTVDP